MTVARTTAESTLHLPVRCVHKDPEGHYRVEIDATWQTNTLLDGLLDYLRDVEATRVHLTGPDAWDIPLAHGALLRRAMTTIHWTLHVPAERYHARWWAYANHITAHTTDGIKRSRAWATDVSRGRPITFTDQPLT